jgi:hypothetical protein
MLGPQLPLPVLCSIRTKHPFQASYGKVSEAHVFERMTQVAITTSMQTLWNKQTSFKSIEMKGDLPCQHR